MIWIAWIPVLDPLPSVHVWWWAAAVPICVLLSLGYKAVTLAPFARLWRRVLVMTAQLLVALASIAAAVALIGWLL